MEQELNTKNNVDYYLQHFIRFYLLNEYEYESILYTQVHKGCLYAYLRKHKRLLVNTIIHLLYTTASLCIICMFVMMHN